MLTKVTRTQIEALKRDIWAAKTVVDEALNRKVALSQTLAEANNALVDAQIKHEFLRSTLIAMLDDAIE